MVHAAASHSEFGWIVHPGHVKLHCAARQTLFFVFPRVTGARSAAGCPAELRSLTCARVRNFAVFINFFRFFLFFPKTFSFLSPSFWFGCPRTPGHPRAPSLAHVELGRYSWGAAVSCRLLALDEVNGICFASKWHCFC